MSQDDSAGPERAPTVAAGNPALDPPPRPRCALRVAVVGHRRFEGESDDASDTTAAPASRCAFDACVSAWAVIVGAMRAALALPVTADAHQARPGSSGEPGLVMADVFNGDVPELIVLSSLAAGADQIGARAALEVGRRSASVAVVLEAVLPFAAQDYPGAPAARRPEFRPAEAETLEALAGVARQVVRLGGRYLADPRLAPDDPVNRHSRERAYQQARDVLLQNADLILALYDPARPRKAGGSIETIDLALAAGRPVVAILVRRDQVRMALYAESEHRPSDAATEWGRACPVADASWRAALGQRIGYLLALPHVLAPIESDESPEQFDERRHSLARTVARARLYFGETRIHGMCRSPVLARVFETTWRVLLWLAPACATAPSLPARAGARAHDSVTLEPYARHYRRASALTAAYMRTYRGAFVLVFALAASAVSAAVALLAVAVLTHGHPPLAAIVGLGGAKVVILAALIALERASRQLRPQEFAADFRYLAEILRPMQWLAPAATSVPAVAMPAHYAPLDPRQSWTTWVFRAVRRAAPLVAAPLAAGVVSRDVRLDRAAATTSLEAARREWLQGQIDYHRDNARTMHGLDNGLERLAKVILWAVLACAVMAAVIEIALVRDLVATPGGLRLAAVVLGAFAAALPAWIAAFGGILFQSEARRLRIRSEAMYHGLVARSRHLDAHLAGFLGDAPTGCDTAIVAQDLRHLAGVMIEETGDWKALYELHDVKAG